MSSIPDMIPVVPSTLLSAPSAPHQPTPTPRLRPCLVTRRPTTSTTISPRSPLHSLLSLQPDLMISTTPDTTSTSTSTSASALSSPMSSRNHSVALPHVGVRVVAWDDEEEEGADEVEAYMRSGLMALRLVAATEMAVARGADEGRRRKRVAWAGDNDEEQEREVVVLEAEAETQTSPSPQVEQNVNMDDAADADADTGAWIDEDGQVWQQQQYLEAALKRARSKHQGGGGAYAQCPGRREDMQLFSVHLTYSPSEYDRTPLDPPTEEERACSLPDRGSRVFADVIIDSVPTHHEDDDDDGAESDTEDVESSTACRRSASSRHFLWSSCDASTCWEAGTVEDTLGAGSTDAAKQQEEQEEQDEWEAWLDQRKSAKSSSSSYSAGSPLVEAAASACNLVIAAAALCGGAGGTRSNELCEEDVPSDTPSLASNASSTASSSDCSRADMTIPHFNDVTPHGLGFESWLPYSSAYGRQDDDGGLDTPGAESDGTIKPNTPKSGKKHKRGVRPTAVKRTSSFADGGAFGCLSSEFGLPSMDNEGCLGGF